MVGLSHRSLWVFVQPCVWKAQTSRCSKEDSSVLTDTHFVARHGVSKHTTGASMEAKAYCRHMVHASSGTLQKVDYKWDRVVGKPGLQKELASLGGIGKPVFFEILTAHLQLVSACEPPPLESQLVLKPATSRLVSKRPASQLASGLPIKVQVLVLSFTKGPQT